jgi:hypothetical protein
MEILRNSYNIFVEKRDERDDLKDLGADGRTALNCILNKEDMKVWNGFIWH